MSRPGAINELKDDLDYIAKSGFNVIISLYDPLNYFEAKFAKMDLSSYGIEHFSMVFKDFSIPNLEDTIEMLKLIEKKIKTENKKVLIHCGAGYGRTGTLAALYLRYKDRELSGRKSIKKIRHIYNTCAIETKEQEKFVKNIKLWAMLFEK
jgi:atypical dual specificity phosphatase